MPVSPSVIHRANSAAPVVPPVVPPPGSRRHSRRPAVAIEPIESRLLLSATPIQSGQTIAGVVTSSTQVDMYSFSASAGDSIQATLGDANASSGLLPELQLLAPDGSRIRVSESNDTNTFVTTFTQAAPSTGTYTLLVQANNINGAPPSTGAYNIELANAPAVQAADPDGDGGAISSGQTRSGSIQRLGNMDVYTFSASAGDAIQATLADADANSPLLPELQLFAPDGTAIATKTAGGNNGFVTTGTQTAPSTGTYTLLVQANIINGFAPTTGAYNLELVKVPAAQAADPDGDGGAISSGQTRSGSIQRLGNMDVYTFAASAGDAIQATLGDAGASSALLPELQLIGPDGGRIQTTESFDTNTFVTTGALTAPLTGTYTLVVQAAAINGPPPSTGAYNLELVRVPAVQAADPDGDSGMIHGNQTRPGSIQRLGNMDVYTFSASAGDSFQATLADADASSALLPQLQLFGPDGTPIQTRESFSNNTSVSTSYTVPPGGGGAYTLVVQAATINGPPPSTGAYTLTLAGSITPGPTVSGPVAVSDSAAVMTGQAQRSQVRNLIVTFSEPVTLGARPFTLQRLNTGGSGANNNSSPTDASAALGAPAAVPGSNNTQWAVPLLASTAFTDATAGLADGIYQVVVAAAQVTSAATGTHLASDFTTPAFHRLFGDTDGNKTVNALDYARFKSVFGSSAGNAAYNADLDFDNNGTVNALDYAQFKLRFGKTFSY